MLNAFVEIVDYISYYMSGTTRHGLHSPFVYNFADFVLYQNSNMNFEMIENQRLSMIQSKSKFEKISLSEFAANNTLKAKYGRLLQRMTDFYPIQSILEIGNNSGIESNYLLSNIVINQKHLEFYSTLEVNDYFQKVRNETVSAFDQFYQANFVEIHKNDQLMNHQLVDLMVFHGQPNDAEQFWKFYDQYKFNLGTQSMLILTNIRITHEHYLIWNQMSHLNEVTASIELFNMGILFFRTEQLQQKFILRY